MNEDSDYTIYEKAMIDEETQKSWQYKDWVLVESEQDGGIIAEFSTEENAELFCLVRELADVNKNVVETKNVLNLLIASRRETREYTKIMAKMLKEGSLPSPQM